MSFLLDTCAISEMCKPEPDADFVQWLDSCDDDMLNICTVTLGELRYGIDILPAGRRKNKLLTWYEMICLSYSGHITEVTQAAFVRWGALRANRKSAGCILPMADGLIAAVATINGMTVVTRNTDDFSDLGVDLINPWSR